MHFSPPFSFAQAIIAGAVAIGILVVGGFAVAAVNENLQDQIDDNENNINTLRTRTNGACNALNTLGSVATVTDTGNDPNDLNNAIIAINRIIAAGGTASCTA